MERFLPLSGELKGLELPLILYNISKKSISGILEVSTNKTVKKIIIKNSKVIFAQSNQKEDSLGSYLHRENIIDDTKLEKASDYMEKKNIRFGRALIELGYMVYDDLWLHIQSHLKNIIFSLLYYSEAHYQIITDIENNDENIILDSDILSIIIEGMRYFSDKKMLYQQLKNIQNIYLYKPEIVSSLDFKPYEIHILNLVRRESSVKEIIKRSELLKFDTLRIIYLFLVLELISPEKIEPLRKVKMPISSIYDRVSDAPVDGPAVSTFVSFDEALKHFNLKYELIYKVLSKEIGPIALSIFQKAIDDIAEKLPFFFKKISLNSTGSLKEEPILKSVWYYEFDEYIGDFLKGLEEILYAEIYAVKKHLGIEYEQQILKWIN